MLRALPLLLLLTATPVQCAWGHCAPAPEDRTTAWGHQNAVTVYQTSLQDLRGVVVLGFHVPEVKAEAALVEVFDHPEIAEMAIPNRTGQKRIRACLTQGDGTFSFHLPPGKYELRCSKVGDQTAAWNCASVIVEIKRDASSKRLKVRLELAE